MKRWVKQLGSIMIAGALLTGTAAVTGFGGTSKAYAAEGVQQNLITVLGKGEISVKPDIVYLSIGAESYAATAKSAQKSNAQKIEKVMKLLKDTWKINDKDIKTEQFYVQPNYTYDDKEGRKVQNYAAYHSLEVTLRDLSKVGDLLDAAAEEGANSIGNARFSVENRDAFEEQVIDKAIANADLKAKAIAKASKRQLGVVVSVVEGAVGTDRIYGLNEMAAKVESSMANDAGSTSVKPGEIKISTQLYVQYELK
ncbi:SIMPL domain-containing protein [Paenibacillus sp. JCM 10914]|uniref:SIMPL domain-containing protein n=1 Tax=Paenibacillus sp. JCM 10914 TaxID=1236974 RepID=UPI0003CCB45C|nr:SIMPL domain-containing protein [Paenibacillus sp. JCM 10914]GAE08682.1 putative glycosyl hydrolase [Paenibacillus sp. JCM 10914]